MDGVASPGLAAREDDLAWLGVDQQEEGSRDVFKDCC